MDRSIHFMETGPESGIIKQFLYLYKDENRMFGFKVKMTIIKWTQLSAAGLQYKLGFGELGWSPRHKQLSGRCLEARGRAGKQANL